MPQTKSSRKVDQEDIPAGRRPRPNPGPRDKAESVPRRIEKMMSSLLNYLYIVKIVIGKVEYTIVEK